MNQPFIEGTKLTVNTSFTKGEWYYSNGEIVAMPSQVKVCRMRPIAPYPDTEGQANIRLIETAPEVLKVLFAMVAEDKNVIPCDSPHPAQTIKRAMKLLEKAGVPHEDVHNATQ